MSAIKDKPAHWHHRWCVLISLHDSPLDKYILWYCWKSLFTCLNSAPYLMTPFQMSLALPHRTALLMATWTCGRLFTWTKSVFSATLILLIVHLTYSAESLDGATTSFYYFPWSSNAAQRTLLTDMLFTAFTLAALKFVALISWFGAKPANRTFTVGFPATSGMLSIIPIFVEAIFVVNAALCWYNTTFKWLLWNHFARGTV